LDWANLEGELARLLFQCFLK